MRRLCRAVVPNHRYRSFIAFILAKSPACVPLQKARLSGSDELLQDTIGSREQCVLLAPERCVCPALTRMLYDTQIAFACRRGDLFESGVARRIHNSLIEILFARERANFFTYIPRLQLIGIAHAPGLRICLGIVDYDFDLQGLVVSPSIALDDM